MGCSDAAQPWAIDGSGTRESSSIGDRRLARAWPGHRCRVGGGRRAGGGGGAQPRAIERSRRLELGRPRIDHCPRLRSARRFGDRGPGQIAAGSRHSGAQYRGSAAGRGLRHHGRGLERAIRGDVLERHPPDPSGVARHARTRFRPNPRGGFIGSDSAHPQSRHLERPASRTGGLVQDTGRRSGGRRHHRQLYRAGAHCHGQGGRVRTRGAPGARAWTSPKWKSKPVPPFLPGATATPRSSRRWRLSWRARTPRT